MGLFCTTFRIFLWKHWKCFRFSWIMNTLFIVLPILLTWALSYVMHVTTKGEQATFDPVDTVSEVALVCSMCTVCNVHVFSVCYD